uniref:Histone-arginine methyltransferase CARM1 n=1 Tax=Junco hyemalis TaxID=40217 RepID=A0A8C5JPC2_JUNHY
AGLPVLVVGPGQPDGGVGGAGAAPGRDAAHMAAVSVFPGVRLLTVGDANGEIQRHQEQQPLRLEVRTGPDSAAIALYGRECAGRGTGAGGGSEKSTLLLGRHLFLFFFFFFFPGLFFVVFFFLFPSFFFYGFFFYTINTTAPIPPQIVLDVGCGSGILSFFAAQAGARKIYAVEASTMAQHAEVLVKSNNLTERIVVIPGKVEEVSLPEQVDIIISEPMGYMLFNERMLESYLHAKKYLKPSGNMFPTIGDVHLAPFTDEQLYMEQFTKANFWYQPSFHGVDLSALRGAAVDEYFRQPVVDTFDIRILMAKSVKYTVNFLEAKEGDLHRIEIPFKFHMLHSGLVHGLAFWFDVAFIGSMVIPGHPRVIPGHPRALLGHPRVLWRHPGVTLGHPRVIPGHPRVLLGHPSVILGHSKVILGHSKVILGHPGVLVGHPRVILGHPSVLLGHPSAIPGHPGVLLGHPGTPQCHPRALLGHPRVLLGHPNVTPGSSRLPVPPPLSQGCTSRPFCPKSCGFQAGIPLPLCFSQALGCQCSWMGLIPPCWLGAGG